MGQIQRRKCEIGICGWIPNEFQFQTCHHVITCKDSPRCDCGINYERKDILDKSNCIIGCKCIAKKSKMITKTKIEDSYNYDLCPEGWMSASTFKECTCRIPFMLNTFLKAKRNITSQFILSSLPQRHTMQKIDERVIFSNVTHFDCSSVCPCPYHDIRPYCSDLCGDSCCPLLVPTHRSIEKASEPILKYLTRVNGILVVSFLMYWLLRSIYFDFLVQ